MPSINCQHSPLSQLDARQEYEHFDECLSLDAQREQLIQWRDAARKWWDHQERVNQLDHDVPPEVMEQAVKALASAHPHDAGVDCIPLNPADMCVVVVLPEGNSLTLASRQPVDPEILSEVTAWERNIMQALLRYAMNELLQSERTQSFGVPVPSPYPQPYTPGF